MTATINNLDDSEHSATVQLHYWSGNPYEMLAEATEVSIAPNSSARVELEWDTSGHKVGVHPLLLSLLTPDQTNTLDVEEFDVLLVSDDIVFVLIRSANGTLGSIVGSVAKPSVVASPEYPPTATPTPSPTPTPTGTPTTSPTPTQTPTPTPALRSDAEIVGIISSPVEGAVQGQWVEISVMVRNNATEMVGVPVQLSFPSPEKQPETITLRIPPDQSATAVFTWKTRNYDIGHHTLKAELRLENNGTSGLTATEIILNLSAPSITASIVGFSIDPELPVVGDPVYVSVAVKNEGVLPAGIPVTLHFPSAGKLPETRVTQSEPGATVFATFTWRTSRYEPGTYRFRVEVPGADPTFTVHLASPEVDFSIVELYAPDENIPIVRGDSVDVYALVSNSGPHAGRATVTLSDASGGHTMYSEYLALQAQESRTLGFTWKTLRYALGTYHLQVATDAANDSNRDNDVSRIGFATIVDDRDITIGYGSSDPQSHYRQELAKPDVPASPNFSIAAISWVPPAPVVGDAVSIKVEISNNGKQASSAPVTLHFPSEDKQPETRRPRIGAGQTESATFTWRTSRYEPGTYRFRVEVPGADPTFTVHLASPEVDFSIVELYAPDENIPIVRGDSVDVYALVSNSGPHAGRATVTLSDASGGHTMYSEYLALQAQESRTLGFTWKTLRYALGTYHLQVATDAANDSNRDNDVSRIGFATIVDDRDITIGYGSSDPQSHYRQELAKPDVPASPNFSIAAISWVPPAPVVGDAVSIKVEISNNGKQASSAPVTLHFPSEDKQPETRRPRIGAGQTESATFTWRTSRYEPGTYSFRVESVNANSNFSVVLLPPTADFEVVAIYAPHSDYPIARGDWVEVSAFVRNIGEYESKAEIGLRNLTHRRLMYAENVNLGSGESRVVEFTWKTLRSELGEHLLQVEAEGEYDINPSNNHSDPASMAILTNRDITLGFAGHNPTRENTVETAVPRVKLVREHSNHIASLGSPPLGNMGLRIAPPQEPFSAKPSVRMEQSVEPAGDSSRQNFRMSPFLCSKQQQLTGELKPREALCSGVWARVR